MTEADVPTLEEVGVAHGCLRGLRADYEEQSREMLRALVMP